MVFCSGSPNKHPGAMEDLRRVRGFRNPYQGPTSH